MVPRSRHIPAHRPRTAPAPRISTDMSRSHAHAGVFGDDAGPQHRASSVPPASNGGSPAATPHTSPARSLSSSAPPSPTDEFESTHYPIRRNTPTPSYSPPRDPSQATLVALPQATYPLPPTYSVPHQSFDGYDLIVPLSAVAAISLLFLGPLLAPKVYLVFLFAYFASFLCLSITHSYKWSLSAARVKRTIREAERGGEEEKLMRVSFGPVWRRMCYLRAAKLKVSASWSCSVGRVKWGPL